MATATPAPPESMLNWVAQSTVYKNGRFHFRPKQHSTNRASNIELGEGGRAGYSITARGRFYSRHRYYYYYYYYY
jgi:hypothetical protein